MSIAENPLANPILQIDPMILDFINNPVDYSFLRDIKVTQISKESHDFVHKIFMDQVSDPTKRVSFNNFKEASDIFKSAMGVSKKH